MDAWLAFAGMSLSGLIAAVSLRAIRQADHTGQVRVWFYPFGVWADRGHDPRRFKRAVATLEYRMCFFLVAMLIAGASLLEQDGLLP